MRISEKQIRPWVEILAIVTTSVAAQASANKCAHFLRRELLCKNHSLYMLVALAFSLAKWHPSRHIPGSCDWSDCGLCVAYRDEDALRYVMWEANIHDAKADRMVCSGCPYYKLLGHPCYRQDVWSVYAEQEDCSDPDESLDEAALAIYEQIEKMYCDEYERVFGS